MAEFGIQIEFDELTYDENFNVSSITRTISLSNVSEPSATLTNTITTHPIVNGDMVADHGYKQPLTLAFNATVALKGNKGITLDNVEISPLEAINIFEAIKNNLYICKIAQISLLNSSDVRFKQYSNMVITSLTHTEYINTVEFMFSWQQVLLVDVDIPKAAIDDEFLPTIDVPKPSMFTDTLIDWSVVDASIINCLKDNGLVEDNFLSYLALMVNDEAWLGAVIVASIGAGAALAATLIQTGAIVGGAIKAAITIALGSNPVGWIVIAAGAAVALVIGLVGIFKRAAERQKYLFEPFTFDENDDKHNEEEATRFTKFLIDMHTQFEQLNNEILVYQIGSNDDQEVIVAIDNLYYTFKFTTNNIEHTVICDVFDMDNNVVTTMQDVSSAPISFFDCNTNNVLFTTSTNTYVYIINCSKDTFKLMDCYIFVSTINPQDFDKILTEIIERNIFAS